MRARDPAALQKNEGMLIVDATCASQDIKYLQEIELLNQACKNTENMITQLHDPRQSRKPRTIKSRHAGLPEHGEEEAQDLQRDSQRNPQTAAISRKKPQSHRSSACAGEHPQPEIFETARYREVPLRTAKIHVLQPNPPCPGPYRKACLASSETDHWRGGEVSSGIRGKLDISVCDGFGRLEKQSFDAYNEAATQITVIERYGDRTGRYMERILADKTYRNRNTLAFCREHAIRLSGPTLWRPKKNNKTYREQDYRDFCECVEME